MTASYLTAARLRELKSQLDGGDLAIIARVASLRFVSGRQLARMNFDGLSARATRRALSRLVRLDCLARLPRRIGGGSNGSKSYVYYLAPAGQRLAIEQGWLPQRRTRRALTAGTLFVAHTLQVAELHTLLIEAERAGQVELLALEAEPACHRPSGGSTLKPDSFVELAIDEDIWSYFIEIDMGSEGSQAIERQLGQYVEYEATGIEQAERGVFPLTLWLSPDSERAEAIRACIERLPRLAQGLFTATEFGQAITRLTNGSAPKGLPAHEKIDVRERGDLCQNK